MEATKRKAQLSDKFEDGIFLGIKDGTEELIVGTPTGCKICRSVKRRSRADAADPVFVNSVRGTPWCLVPDDAVREPRIPTQFDVRPASVELPPKIATADHSGPRRIYIREAVQLARYGYTPNCAGCEAAEAGVPGFVKPHTEECRARIIQAMSEDEGLSSRVRGASERMALAEPEKKRRFQPEETSSSPSTSTPPTATSATVTTATVPVLTRTGVKRAAEDPHDDTGSRDPQDDDDAAMDEFCVLERFEKERDRNPLLREIVDEKLEDRFLERIGFECVERRAVRRDLEKLGQNLNDVHMAEIFSPPRATAESHRFGLTPGMVFDIRTGWNLDDSRKLKQLWEYLRTERPMLIIGSSECKAISNPQSLNRDSPNFQRALEAGIRHPTSARNCRNCSEFGQCCLLRLRWAHDACVSCQCCLCCWLLSVRTSSSLFFTRCVGHVHFL